MSLYRKRTLNCKAPIVILSVISLIFTLISSITYFVYFESNYSDGNYSYEIATRFPSLLSLLSLALSIAPKVLLAIYVLKFFKEYKATIIIPVAFAAIAVSPLISIISSFIYGSGFTIANLIMNIVIIGTFTMATVSALKGLQNKIFIVIPIVLGLILNLFSLLSIFSVGEIYVRNGMFLYLITTPAGIVASTTFYIALLLFGTKNRIPAILALSPEKEKRSVEKMSSEQALRMLKDKLELGMISEEEYKEQRNDIISKL